MGARLARLGLSLALALAGLACAAISAGAIDLDVLATAQSRQTLNTQLDQARREVERTRVEAEAARRQLDAFLGRHFEQQREVGPPQFDPAPAPAEAEQVADEPPDPRIKRLEEDLAELRLHRLHLLTYLTEAHPEVIEVDVRMATISERLAELQPVAELPSPPLHAELEGDDAEAERKWAQFVEQHKQQTDQDALEYERLFAQWRRCEEALSEALDQWEAAQQAVVLLPEALDDEPLAATDPEEPADAEALVAASPAPHESPRGASGSPGAPGSAPLALAALLIALAVAALAAVRLARSAVDPVFASIDEVAAALAVPVVGILPAAAGTAHTTVGNLVRRLRGAVILVVIAAIAAVLLVLAVKNAEGLAGLVRESISGMR